MSKQFTYDNSEFDDYAAVYDAALERGISVSGENKYYFARRRVEWLAGCLRPYGSRPNLIMDFGCGTGTATPFLLDQIVCEHLIGVDTSEKSLEVARQTHGSERASFQTFAEYQPAEEIDLAFCNGVFHHIPPDERSLAVDYVCRSLRPGGFFVVWENNPWNPGTRYVMSRIPFDRDAVPVSSIEMGRLLSAGGFEILRKDFIFIFPRVLRSLRRFEPYAARWPLGAQYMVLARRADHTAVREQP